MKKIIFLVVIIALIGVGGYYFIQEGRIVETPPAYPMEDSIKIAKEWMQNNAPTYTYDGEDLQLKESRELNSEECKAWRNGEKDCYEFDFSFKSRHGGFGDREGKMVTQVITPHITTVTVEHGEVTKAITDNEFNEMTGTTKQGGQGVNRLQPQEVNLYYYNKKEDKNEEGQVLCSAEAVQPVSRIIEGENEIEETIKLLLEGKIRESEKQQGFTTEFPNEDFKLQNTELENGTLTLAFTKAPGFTSGGSCRTGLLKAQIEKTAKQFQEVNEVVIEPETLFQP